MYLSYYTTPGTGPLSWAASKAGVKHVSEEQFRKHASAFYDLDDKEGFFSKIAKAFRGKKKRPRGSWGLRVGKRGDASQRPGFLQGIDDHWWG